MEPDLIKFFSRRLSRVGSSSLPTSSISSGRPIISAVSRCVRKCLWFRFVICIVTSKPLQNVHPKTAAKMNISHYETLNSLTLISEPDLSRSSETNQLCQISKSKVRGQKYIFLIINQFIRQQRAKGPLQVAIYNIQYTMIIVQDNVYSM